MSRAIKVSDEVYALIRKYQGTRESYSDVIKRAFAGLEALQTAQELTRQFPHLPERQAKEVKL